MQFNGLFIYLHLFSFIYIYFHLFPFIFIYFQVLTELKEHNDSHKEFIKLIMKLLFKLFYQRNCDNPLQMNKLITIIYFWIKYF